MTSGRGTLESREETPEKFEKLPAILGPSGVGRVVAIQAFVFVVAEGSNIVVRHFLPLLHRYWIARPFLFVRNTEHTQYSLLGLSGVPARFLFAGVCVLTIVALSYVFMQEIQKDPVVSPVVGILLAGISVNGFEIVTFGYATDFLGLRIPGYGSATVNIADLALGMGLAGLGVVWFRPRWLQPRWKLLSAMTAGALLFPANPATELANPSLPPTSISSSAASSTVQSAARTSWGDGIAVRDVFPVRHCFIYGKDCHADTAWLWEVDLYGKGKFAWWEGQRTSDSASGYVDYGTGQFLGFRIP
jgi:lipoprotein signal peptidase